MPTPAVHDRLLRLLATLGGGLAFIVAATMLQPDWSRADELPATRAPDATDASDDRPPVADLLPGSSLGRLEGPEGSIEVRATPDGPRYHVLGADGRPTDPVGLTLEQLASRYPGLDLRDAAAAGDAPPTLFMLADPDAGWNH